MNLLIHFYCKGVHASVCVCAYVSVSVCEQSYYLQRHNELVSHISSGKSLDNYAGLSLHLSHLPSVCFLFLFSLYSNKIFIYLHTHTHTPHTSFKKKSPLLLTVNGTK